MSADKTPTNPKRSSRPTAAAQDRAPLPQDDGLQDAASPIPIDAPADIEERIRQRAYAIYTSRNAEDGSELEDWLAAEREIRFAHDPTEGRGARLLGMLSETEEREIAR